MEQSPATVQVLVANCFEIVGKTSVVNVLAMTQLAFTHQKPNSSDSLTWLRRGGRSIDFA